MIPVYITDIIGEVVTAVSSKILSTIQANETVLFGETSIQVIDYQYGHKRELIETLFQMSQSSEERFKKYPLIYLVQDFSEERGAEPGVYATVSLNVIIAHHTDSKYKITDRMTNVFKPVLYPLYYEFINQLTKNKWIKDAEETMVRHRKTDRSQWGRVSIGKNDATKLNDYVDAIEIENLALKIYYSNC